MLMYKPTEYYACCGMSYYPSLKIVGKLRVLTETQPIVLQLLLVLLANHVVPSRLGYELLSLSLAHLLSYLHSTRIGIVDLCGLQNLGLGILNDFYC